MDEQQQQQQQQPLSSWSLDPDQMSGGGGGGGGGDSLLPQPDGQDELAKYLDLDFDFDFTALDNVIEQAETAANIGVMQDVQLTGVGVDEVHTSHPPNQELHQHQHQHHHQQQQQPSVYSTPNFGQMQPANTPQSSAVQQSAGPHFHAQKHQTIAPQGYGQRQAFIPPTPNSMEMQARSVGYPVPLDTGSQRAYEPYYQSADDQSAFTPLISPAMTPLDQQYRLPEYTVPGEYLTPLTSPALEGHNPNSGFYYNNTTGQNDAAFTSSPMEPPSSHASGANGPLSPGIAKKNRRKQSTQPRAATRTVRQSPSVRPQTGRQRTKAIPESSNSAEAPGSATSQKSSTSNGASSAHLRSNDSSGQDSVSPEPLTEPLMPPPALPRPAKSSHVAARESNQGQESTTAATPASLMKLQNQQQQQHRDDVPQKSTPQSANVGFSDTLDEPMEDISFPEPASGSLQSSTVAEHTTPSLSGSQTPVPASSDRPQSGSVGPSPQIGAMQSPTGPVGTKRADSVSSTKTAKRRQNPSSTQASPALRPKISPNLKPLASNRSSEGTTSETSALYLASKSNYQHILEGTVLPGVSFPDSLAENLSSKRTNHKLAEQGRRNRMNIALKEMEALLPPSLSSQQDRAANNNNNNNNKDKERKDIDEASANGASKSPDKSSAAAGQPTSKASTVEMAIVYVRALQQELVETQGRLKAAETKLEEKNTGGGAAEISEAGTTDKKNVNDDAGTRDAQDKADDQSDAGTVTASAGA